MRTIHKQSLKIKDTQEIELPHNSDILHIGIQGNSVCIWYECDTEQPKEKVKIYCYGTGHEIPQERTQKYIGTVIVFNGSGVFHFYQDIPQEQ